MTDTKQETTQLLTAEEQDICQKIVVQDADIAGQRAATLLAINGGVAHAEASEQTGLTVGQIRYLVTAFRKKRLAIFPDDILNKAQLPADGGEGQEALSEDEVSLDQGAEEETIEQATPKAKKEKKTKKAKKSKKDKGKKSKKGKGKDKKKKKGKKSKKGKAKKDGKKKSGK